MHKYDAYEVIYCGLFITGEIDLCYLADEQAREWHGHEEPRRLMWRWTH